LPFGLHVGPVLLRRPEDFFFTVRPRRHTARQRVARLTASPSRAFSSARVASGASRTAARIRAASASRAAVRRPCRRGATSPVAARRCLSRRTQAALTRYFRATAAVVISASQSANTRSRRSIEYARITSPPEDLLRHTRSAAKALETNENDTSSLVRPT